jgi:PAS domain S-box-containing protein
MEAKATQQKQQKEALRHSEDFYRSIIDNLPNGAIFVVDHDLKYILAEGSALNDAGFASDDLEGKTIWEALDTELASKYEPYFRMALSGESFKMLHHAHGRHYSSSGRPLTDAHGKIYAVLIVSYDITEQKIAEQALKESEERFRIMTNGLPLMIWVHDSEGNQKFVNTTFTEFFGTSPEATRGEKWEELIHPDDKENYTDVFLASVKSRAPFNARARVRRSDGEWRWVESWGKPRFSPSEKFFGYVGASLDITDKIKADNLLLNYNKHLEEEVKNYTAELESQYEELEALNRVIKQMAWRTIDALENERKALSKDIHDGIAGTLAAIKMQLESHIRASGRKSTVKPMPLEQIVKHLIDAIKETKTISKQLRSTTLDDFGLKAAVREHLREFEEFYPDIEIVSRIELEQNEPTEEVQTVIYRVLQEALNNVAKHSKATILNIKLTSKQDNLFLEITDNGCGFHLPALQKNTEPLTGYGLHSMRERVELCNGKFEIHSEPEKGTAIQIFIPC